MDKRQLEKNKLDLEYHKYTQILNAILIFATTGLLGFIGSFIFLVEEVGRLFIGLSISIIVLVFSYGLYRKIDKKLQDISKKMDKI